jgi:hypothetical protein
MRTLMFGEQQAVAGGLVGAGNLPNNVLLADDDNVGTPWQSELEIGGCNANGDCVVTPIPFDSSWLTGAFTNVGVEVQRFDDGTTLTTIFPVVPWPANHNGACGESPSSYTSGVCSGWVSSWIV